MGRTPKLWAVRMAEGGLIEERFPQR